ncbi:MAG: nucleotidyl transferase AbiEii/AbiGii toxin family protein [Saprospiraceae bacterium]|nr:nucleotidyl transferase AbiEii/AbiGii toxin family protein [Saprospiraceae bacterium]
MLSLSQIQTFYPPQLHVFGSFLLREYLQHKILALIFSSDYANKFAFLGGTCLRIVHQTNRFSEDLDFDNFDLSAQDFEHVARYIQQGLEREGFQIEMQQVYRGAYHCYIKFPNLLHEAGLSGHREAKILIQLDTEPQNFDFTPETFLLNKFDVFANIRITPIDLLLSQKITAFLKRKQPKGRDIYDITFLSAKTKPNYAYLEQRLDVKSAEALKELLLNRLNTLNLNQQSKDVAPFLFYNQDLQRILLFENFVKQAHF